MKSRLTYCTALSLVLMLGGGHAYGQKAKMISVAKNGISVAEWKLYDERSLLQKFNSLRKNVDTNSNFIDVTSLKAAIGKVQSATAVISQLGIGLQVQGPVRTSNNTSDTKTTSATDASGATTTTGTSTGESASGMQQTAVQQPGAAKTDLTSGLTPTGTNGMGYLDTLAEQTQLTYEMFNISMLLERSISDRVLDLNPKTNPGNFFPKQTAVLEFPITISKPVAGCVAEVTIKIKTTSGKTEAMSDAPSIIAMMPKARTYNTASFTSSTRGFSFGTVFDSVGITASGQNNNAKSFLARDVDTVAFENVAKGVGDDGKGYVSFTWQFRPTLTRNLIEPGTREVFVALSLPQDSTGTLDNTGFQGDVSVKTAWRLYCRTNGEVGNERYSDSYDLPALAVRAVPYRNLSLRPIITDFAITDAGAGKVVATVEGANFFDPTVVSLGSTTGSDTDFAVYSENNLRFSAPAAKLLINDPEIVGPYGVGAFPANLSYGLEGVAVVDDMSGVTPIDADHSRVHLVLDFKSNPKTSHGRGTFALMLPGKNVPILFGLGNLVFGLSDAPVDVIDVPHSDNLRAIEFVVPTDAIRQYRKITVMPLLFNKSLAKPYWPKLFYDFKVDSIKILSSNSKEYILALAGRGLEGTPDPGKLTTKQGVEGANLPPDIEPLTLIVNGNPAKVLRTSYGLVSTDTLLLVSVPKDDFENADQLVIFRAKAYPYFAEIKDIKTPKDPPSDKPANIVFSAVTLNYSGDILVSGDNLASIASATVDGDDVKWGKNADKKNKITLTLKLTKLLGVRQVAFTLKDKTVVTASFTVSGN